MTLYVSYKNTESLLWICCFLYIGATISYSGKVQMRIVHETSNYGYFGNNFGDNDNHDQLVAKVKPANIIGPSQLHYLLGTCYNITLDKYRYVFCPFQNITQYEVSLRWNAYQGILGVWSHWYIENNTFAAMVFTHGDTCGNSDRSVKVYFECGAVDMLTNVTEPVQCQYVAKFITKLVCHKDALLVYPRLNHNFQERWDRLWTEYQFGYLTDKGYHNSLQKLFEEAGLIKQLEVMKNDTTTIVGPMEISSTINVTEINSCRKEVLNLTAEITRLNEEVNFLKMMLTKNKNGDTNQNYLLNIAKKQHLKI